MRVLIANEGIDDAGGVDTYLRAVSTALVARGHQVGFLHYNRRRAESRFPAQPAFGVLDAGLDRAAADVAAWAPDLVFSHNMQPLAVEQRLLRWPVVKMMHGYFGTCISGQKAHRFPAPVPCNRCFDSGCLVRFFPRRCGEARPIKMARQYAWARRQQVLFGAYAAIVVASDHMRDEYVRNGAPAGRVHALPLFAPGTRPAAPGRPRPSGDRVLFLGRMTDLKGGDLLVKAVANAGRRMGRSLRLTLAGDGPARRKWEALARESQAPAEFTGWVGPERRACLLQESMVLVMPSIWPEPFGLVGLEAAAEGVPSIAFDSGGVREWLADGVNGILAGGVPSATALADALVSLLSDEGRRLRLAAGAAATARAMTIDRHVDRLVHEVFEPVLAARVGV